MLQSIDKNIVLILKNLIKYNELTYNALSLVYNENI